MYACGSTENEVRSPLPNDYLMACSAYYWQAINLPTLISARSTKAASIAPVMLDVVLKKGNVGFPSYQPHR